METITKYLQIFQPLLDVALALAVPLLAAKLYQWLGVKEDKERVEIEKALREAIHASAVNAVNYAIQRHGSPGLRNRTELVSTALQYVEDKNPEQIKKLGVNVGQLRDIILSKIPTAG